MNGYSGIKKKLSGPPNPIDVHVGNKLRLRRNMLGMSQEQLGKAAGLTFQQIQKYERGVNRISASRLFQIANLLGVSVSYFFDELEKQKEGCSKSIGMSDITQQKLEPVFDEKNELLQRKETLALLRAFYRIKDAKQRRKVYELIRTIARQK